MHAPSLRFARAPRFARSQGGFTLVELITVIVILGVLAAVALPRFASLGGSARAAKAQAIAGSIKSAAAMVKAQAVAQAVSCASASVTSGVTLEGQAIDLNYCVPQAVTGAKGILSAANVSASDGFVITGGGAAGGTALVLQVTGAAVAANCQVTYTSPSAADTPPTVVVDVSNC